MTPFDLTQCPPPEGMEWHEDGCGGFIAQAPNRTLRIDPEAEEGIRVSAWNVDDNVHFYTTLADLPTAYRRALIAVGLASPWTSEVPTEAGWYAAAEPDWGVDLYEFDSSDNSWRLARGGDWIEGKLFDPGTRFMPCPQPPKET